MAREQSGAIVCEVSLNGLNISFYHHNRGNNFIPIKHTRTHTQTSSRRWSFSSDLRLLKILKTTSLSSFPNILFDSLSPSSSTLGLSSLAGNWPTIAFPHSSPGETGLWRFLLFCFFFFCLTFCSMFPVTNQSFPDIFVKINNDISSAFQSLAWLIRQSWRPFASRWRDSSHGFAPYFSRIWLPFESVCIVCIVCFYKYH